MLCCYSCCFCWSNKTWYAQRQAICQIFNDYSLIRKPVLVIAHSASAAKAVCSMCYLRGDMAAIYTLQCGFKTPSVSQLCMYVCVRGYVLATDKRIITQLYSRFETNSSRLFNPIIIVISLCAHEELKCLCKLRCSTISAIIIIVIAIIILCAYTFISLNICLVCTAKCVT